MRSVAVIEAAAIVCTLAVGLLLFVWAVGSSGSIPVEYRSASPGFGWGWEYDYDLGVGEAGRFGEAPWPWPATASDGRMLLPLNQTLAFRGLELTYRGMTAPRRFRLDVAIAHLDPDVTYPREVDVAQARQGLLIDDRRFVLETIMPRYIRLRTADG
ncbi:MAG TPA: hypothetical protein VLT88_12890 [Desulfosarcina sp.]|nr:hypothetical protein [Desulfosarcina sp.]